MPSEHNGIGYFTPRWDALCPYIDVTPEMLACAQQPFIVYAVPPESPFGVPVKVSYGLTDVRNPAFWEDERRKRKFFEIEKRFRSFPHSERVIQGRDLTLDQLRDMGDAHFERFDIHDLELEGFIDYVRDLQVVVLEVHSPEGEHVLTDVSILLPERDHMYGSFCKWNPEFRSRSPGIYACLLACRWAQKNGYRFYNMGPVGGFEYKNIFVTDLEPIYGLALTDRSHPLALDPTSPLHTDFSPEQWNQVRRSRPAGEKSPERLLVAVG